MIQKFTMLTAHGQRERAFLAKPFQAMICQSAFTKLLVSADLIILLLSLYAPASISFDATATTELDGDSLSYAWDFGDGSTGTGKKINHTYTTAGSYAVVLTVTDARQGENIASATIEVKNGFQKGGSTVIASEVPCSFHTPSLLAPLTSSVYSPGARLVYVTRRDLLSVVNHCSLKPSSL